MGIELLMINEQLFPFSVFQRYFHCLLTSIIYVVSIIFVSFVTNASCLFVYFSFYFEKIQNNRKLEKSIMKTCILTIETNFLT